jgi:hypothetical protein
MSIDTDPYITRVRTALSGYTETLLRYVAATLIKPRNPIPHSELIDRMLSTLANPPVIDRRLRDLPAASRKLLAIMGLTHQPRWRVGHLLTTLAAVGHADGFDPIQTTLEAGLLFPERATNAPVLDAFSTWLGEAGVLNAMVFTHPLVSERVRRESFNLDDLSEQCNEPVQIADGLEWTLRLAAVSQLVADTPVRRTQNGAVFKRDLGRIQSHELLASDPSDHQVRIPDGGVLALLWAAAIGQLEDRQGELHVAEQPTYATPTHRQAIETLVSGWSGIESWDPLTGYHEYESGLSPFPSAVVCSVLLLAAASGWVQPASVSQWLWANHTSWQLTLSPEVQKAHGRPWVEAVLLGVLYPLRVVEVCHRNGPWVRLTELGRYLFAGGPPPAEPPAFPQTLLVQPNGEILAYRQGLTPVLIAKLTRLARWKSLGPACTLELTADQTYRGLESGLTLAGIVQTLNQHATRPVPSAVVDLLQRWASKRERISVYPSATLVEFQSPADLESALSRGIVGVRITDRIALCPDGNDPDFKSLRLIGNRDYDTKPTQCVNVGDDGVTLTVDARLSDLLLEAEIGRLAEPIHDEYSPGRRFQITPRSLHRALQTGWKMEDVNRWFVDRTGSPLTATGKLFLSAASLPASLVSKRLVLQLPTAEVADGIVQWPPTARLVEDRLGPTAVTVDEANLTQLVELLTELGVRVEVA